MPTQFTYPEAYLRMALGYVYNAEYRLEYLHGERGGEDLLRAIKHLGNASASIEKWAKKNGVELRESMKT